MFDKYAQRAAVGRRGEEAAAAYLRENGYTIVTRNFRAAGGEIDIIARVEDILCFVEVKTRASAAFGAPEEFVDRHKQAGMVRAAKIYAARPACRHLRLRFDILALQTAGDGFTCRHLQDIIEE